MKPDYRPSDEKRTRSSTGGEKGQKSNRLGGADPLALDELGRVYGFGEEKYARYNYLKGYPFSLSIDALLRHLNAFVSGEDRDPESGLLHTAHVAWHGLALTSFLLRRLGEVNEGFDDRPPAVPEPPTGDPVTYTAPDDCGDCDCGACDEQVRVFEWEPGPLPEPWGTGDGDVYGMSREEWKRYGAREAVDGCYEYRGVHVHPIALKESTFREIDKRLDG